MQIGCEKTHYLTTDSSGATAPNPATSRQESQKTPAASQPKDIIALPLRVHMLTGLAMEKRGVQMNMWVTPKHISQHLLPEINRIWAQANIRWKLERLVVTPMQITPNTQSSMNKILNAQGRADPTRIPHIYSFFPKNNFRPDVFNLYLFPYTGQTSQGNASGEGRNRAVVGVWTDKPSGGTMPPRMFPVFEQLPFKIGSVGRTSAHELGHPNRNTQIIFPRLMGGRKQGYDLIPSEIATARQSASARARRSN